ncbi:MAG: response regulator [Limnothrix sp. RL_2_0]|nr:response regulator [Limnothrix sp. RL_2_0]
MFPSATLSPLEQFTILVVDDNPRNLGVVVDFLETKYETVLVAQDGESAIRRARYAKPHIILLDVLMPGIDGFETCQLLKQDKATQNIPIIFMTALNNPEDKVKGFQMGAVDYITKPIQQDELFARLKVHLQIQDLTKTLAAKNKLLTQYTEELEIQVNQRTVQLSESLEKLKAFQTQLVQQEKMSALGQLMTGLVHEINNPVNFIFGNLEHVESYTQDLLGLIELYKAVDLGPHEDIIKAREQEIDLDFVQEDLLSIVASMHTGSSRIRSIVSSLGKLSHIDEKLEQPINIHVGIDSTVLILKHRLRPTEKRPKIELVKKYGEIPRFRCHLGSLCQVFMNILDNAIDALEEHNQQKSYQEVQDLANQIVIITEQISEGWIKITIADNALGISPADREQIFEPFFTMKSIGRGTGLGLSISRQIIVEKHRGKLECVSTPGEGTEFHIYLPLHL